MPASAMLASGCLADEHMPPVPTASLFAGVHRSRLSRRPLHLLPAPSAYYPDNGRHTQSRTFRSPIVANNQRPHNDFCRRTAVFRPDKRLRLSGFARKATNRDQAMRKEQVFSRFLILSGSPSGWSQSMTSSCHLEQRPVQKPAAASARPAGLVSATTSWRCARAG
jgi:hypothetical protein